MNNTTEAVKSLKDSYKAHVQRAENNLGKSVLSGKQVKDTTRHSTEGRPVRPFDFDMY